MFTVLQRYQLDPIENIVAFSKCFRFHRSHNHISSKLIESVATAAANSSREQHKKYALTGATENKNILDSGETSRSKIRT